MPSMSAYTPQSPTDGREHNSLASRVRSNAGSAGLGAACLLFFGFYYLARPAGSLGASLAARDWFTFGSLILNATMRWGGIGMACASLASLTGLTPALLLDAAVSIPIGVLLIASGAITLAGGGDVLTSILLVVFGWMFIRAGWRNALVFAGARGGGAVRRVSESEVFRASQGDLRDEALEGRTWAARTPVVEQGDSTRTRLPAPVGDSMPLASRLLSEARAERSPHAPPVAATSAASQKTGVSNPSQDPEPSVLHQPSLPAEGPAGRSTSSLDATSASSPPDAPPEGFLAAMARQDPDAK